MLYSIPSDIYTSLIQPALRFIHVIFNVGIGFVYIGCYWVSPVFRYNDPPYVKLKKLELLTHLCDDGNAQNIVEELRWVFFFVLYMYIVNVYMYMTLYALNVSIVQNPRHTSIPWN